MTLRVVTILCATLLFSTAALARSGPDPKPRLKLWDRVLYKRYDQASKLSRQAAHHASRGRYKEAVTLLQRAIAIRPYAASLHFDLGTVQSYAGSYMACVSAISKARNLDPGHEKNLAAFRMGLCLTMSGRIAEGVAEYKKVKPTRWINAAVLHWNLGDSFMAMGRLKEAATHYQLSLQRNSSQLVLHFALAVALDRLGKLRSADRQLRRANRLDPTGSSLNAKDIIWLPAHDHLYYRALRAYSLRQRGEALDWWQRFAKADPRSPWNYVMKMRVALLRTGPFTEADVGLDKGTADRKALAAGLSESHAALRRCLGPAAAPATDLHALRGLRLGVVAHRRGITRVTVLRAFGAQTTSPAACVRAALQKIRWGRVVLGHTPVSFSFSLVGP